MRLLHYAGGTVLIADVLSKALLRYARALADSCHADIVSIPVIENGIPLNAHFLIGPSSQLYATEVDGVPEQIVDLAIVSDLEGRAERLTPGHPSWAEEMTDIPEPGPG